MTDHSGPDHLGLELSFMAARTELTDAQRADDPEAERIAQLKADEAVRLIGELLSDVD